MYKRQEANKLSENLISKFSVIGNMESSWESLSYKMQSPMEYDLNLDTQKHWLIFTDTFNPEWTLILGQRHLNSYPIYSTINGFYISGGINQAKLYMEAQKRINQGVIVSFLSLISLILIVSIYSKRRKTVKITTKNEN